jgi:hypothetical protein
MKYILQGLNCVHCAGKIEQQIRQIPELEDVWKGMEPGRQEQEWYYRGLLEALRQNFRFRPCMFFEFEKLVKELFD